MNNFNFVRKSSTLKSIPLLHLVIVGISCILQSGQLAPKSSQMTESVTARLQQIQHFASGASVKCWDVESHAISTCQIAEGGGAPNTGLHYLWLFRQMTPISSPITPTGYHHHITSSSPMPHHPTSPSQW